MAVFDQEQSRNVAIYREHRSTIEKIAWASAGKVIASCDVSGVVRTWNAETGETFVAYAGHHGAVRDHAITPDGVSVASCGEDGTVQVWGAFTGWNLNTYSGHQEVVLSVRWAPDQSKVASAVCNAVHIWPAWDEPVKERSFALGKEGYPDFALALWSPRGDRLIAIVKDVIQVWMVDTGALECTWSAGRDVLLAEISPDGAHLALAGDDGTVRVVDRETWRESVVYDGHSDVVWALAWSPDGRRVASGGFDNTVRVWDAISGRTLDTYRGHKGSVNGVAWSPDGRQIASGGEDQTVQIWPVRLEEHGEEFSGRILTEEDMPWYKRLKREPRSGNMVKLNFSPLVSDEEKEVIATAEERGLTLFTTEARDNAEKIQFLLPGAHSPEWTTNPLELSGVHTESEAAFIVSCLHGRAVFVSWAALAMASQIRKGGS